MDRFTRASVVTTDMSLLFQPEHIEAVRAGEKTVTRRDWAERHNGPTVGSIQMAVTELFVTDSECDCYVRITDRYRQALGAMTAEDAQKEGGYTLEEFRQVWRDLDDGWDPSTTVDVLEFEYVGERRPNDSGTS